MKKHAILVLLTFFLLLTPAALAEDRTRREFPLNIGDSVYFENGYYKVTLVRTDDVMGFAWFNFSCENCFHEPKELKGYQDESQYYPSKDEQIISIREIRAVTANRAIVNLTFPSNWDWQIVTAEDAKVPKFVITKTVDKTRVKVDEIIQVKITIKNVGNGSASDIDIDEIPSTALIPMGEELEPKIKDPLPAGESDSDTYLVQAVKSGTFNIPKTTVKYESESGEKYTAESDTVSITVLAPEVKLSNLTTTIQFDKSNVLIDEEITATIIIKNVGDAPANDIDLINRLPAGLELVGGALEDKYHEIKPGDSRELNAVIRAAEVGNYTLTPRTVYSDGETSTTSPVISVTEEDVDYTKYMYLIPILLILIIILILVIKRHREYSF
ncbi:hypothetical protein DRN85_03350 [Methanosarcinales archaeon]|mgnify:CR=1 FL=1|nr:MAG: hypothetical protein DRN85_03350 [Methanosarcinales archaeon]